MKKIQEEPGLRKINSKRITLDKLKFTLDSNIGNINRNRLSGDDDMKDIIEAVNLLINKNDIQAKKQLPNKVILDPIYRSRVAKFKTCVDKNNYSLNASPKEKIIVRKVLSPI